MCKETYNKTIVGRRFTDFWGKNVNLGIIDEIAAPDIDCLPKLIKSLR